MLGFKCYYAHMFAVVVIFIASVGADERARVPYFITYSIYIKWDPKCVFAYVFTIAYTTYQHIHAHTPTYILLVSLVFMCVRMCVCINVEVHIYSMLKPFIVLFCCCRHGCCCSNTYFLMLYGGNAKINAQL